MPELRNRALLLFAVGFFVFTMDAFAVPWEWTPAEQKLMATCGDVAIGQGGTNVMGSTASTVLSVVSPVGWGGRGILELGMYPATASENVAGRYAGAIFFANAAQPQQSKELASILVQANLGDTVNHGYSLQFYTKSQGGGSAERLRIDSSGNVGIGTGAPNAKLDVVGDMRVSGTLTGGNIQAHFQDLAEWVPATDDLPAGTVVTLDLTNTNRVTASSSPYDSAVAGVVSVQPGIILGEGGPAKEMIATTGRVKVRVDARLRPIRVGDLLVTSPSPGLAMRSEPLDLNGALIHRPGTILGKALEPLAGGVGEILVLLSLQ